MVDVVDRATRSRMMSGIRGGDTKPEIEVRSALHRQGLRFRLHGSSLPGRPDLVFPKYNAVIFVHGCFWHGHDCKYFRLPATQRPFWKRKIEGNRKRDARNKLLLAAAGWRAMAVWECALRGKSVTARAQLTERLARWVRGKRRQGEFRG